MHILTLSLISALFLNCGYSAQMAEIQPVEVVSPDEPVGDAPVKSEVKKYRFAIISDLNGSYGSTKYASDVSKAVSFITDSNNDIDFVISTGDMVAGQKKNLNYAAMWESFHTTVTRPMLKVQIPLYPSPGNHDAHEARLTERNHYKNSWSAEDVLGTTNVMSLVTGVEQNYPFQYAYRVGEGLFIALDDTAVKNWRGTTLQWMEKVLTQEKDAKVKIIYGHVPLLPFAFKKESEYVAIGNVSFLNKVENLFEQHNVDVFFSGHSHVYYPGRRDGKTEFISVPLLGGGARYLLRPQPDQKSQKGFLVVEYDSLGDWQVFHHRTKDYSLLGDELFPEQLNMPSKNSKLCKKCTSFPNSHFLEASKRVIYRRRDL